MLLILFYQEVNFCHIFLWLSYLITLRRLKYCVKIFNIYEATDEHAHASWVMWKFKFNVTRTLLFQLYAIMYFIILESSFLTFCSIIHVWLLEKRTLFFCQHLDCIKNNLFPFSGSKYSFYYFMIVNKKNGVYNKR